MFSNRSHGTLRKAKDEKESGKGKCSADYSQNNNPD